MPPSRTCEMMKPRFWKKRWASRLSLVVMVQIFAQPARAGDLLHLVQQQRAHAHELAERVDGHQFALAAVDAVGGQADALAAFGGDEAGQLVRVVHLGARHDEVAAEQQLGALLHPEAIVVGQFGHAHGHVPQETLEHRSTRRWCWSLAPGIMRPKWAAPGGRARKSGTSMPDEIGLACAATRFTIFPPSAASSPNRRLTAMFGRRSPAPDPRRARPPRAPRLPCPPPPPAARAPGGPVRHLRRHPLHRLAVRAVGARARGGRDRRRAVAGRRGLPAHRLADQPASLVRDRASSTWCTRPAWSSSAWSC